MCHHNNEPDDFNLCSSNKGIHKAFSVKHLNPLVLYQFIENDVKIDMCEIYLPVIEVAAGCGHITIKLNQHIAIN